MINIDKITLEQLMIKYYIVLEEKQMAKLETQVDLKNVTFVKKTLELFNELLKDERLPIILSVEYKDKLDWIFEHIEYIEYCENGANAHKDVE